MIGSSFIDINEELLEKLVLARIKEVIKVQNDHLESMEKEKISKEAKSKDTKAKGGYLDDLDVPPSESEEDSVKK